MKRLPVLLVLCLWGTAVCAGAVQERNKAMARRVFEEAFSQSRFELANQLYAPNLVNHGLHRNADLKEDRNGASGINSARCNNWAQSQTIKRIKNYRS